MNLKHIYSLLIYFESIILISGCIYGMYYFYIADVSTFGKAFVMLILCVMLILFIKNIFDQRADFQLNVSTGGSNGAPILICIISFLIFMILASVIGYAFLMEQVIHAFPITLIFTVVFYLAFKESLRRLAANQ